MKSNEQKVESIKRTYQVSAGMVFGFGVGILFTFWMVNHG